MICGNKLCLHVVLAIILFAFIFGFWVNQAKAQDLSTATLSVSADAYIYTDGESGQGQYTEYGLSLPWNSVVHNDGSYGWGESVIKFDLSGIPAGSTIDSADMRLYLSTCNGTSSDITVKRIISNWTESTVNWAVGVDMRTTTTGMMQLTSTPCTPNSWYDFYITDIMKAWVAGSTNYGVRLSIPDAGTFSRNFNSREASGTKPQLIVDYYSPASSSSAEQQSVSSLSSQRAATSSFSSSNSSGTDADDQSVSIVPGTSADVLSSSSAASIDSNSLQNNNAESVKTGYIGRVTDYLSSAWNNPKTRAILITICVFILLAIAAVIIILVKTLHKPKPVLTTNQSSPVKPNPSSTTEGENGKTN